MLLTKNHKLAVSAIIKQCKERGLDDIGGCCLNNALVKIFNWAYEKDRTYYAKKAIQDNVECINQDADTSESDKGKKLSELIHGLNGDKSIMVGEFTIFEDGVSPDRVWIERRGGEGGNFSRNKFSKVVKKFYIDNF